MQKAELVNDKPGHLAEEILKPSVEVAAFSSCCLEQNVSRESEIEGRAVKKEVKRTGWF